jgi:hypothetical protein
MKSEDDVGKRSSALRQTGTTSYLNALTAIAKRILDQFKASKDRCEKKDDNESSSRG